MDSESEAFGSYPTHPHGADFSGRRLDSRHTHPHGADFSGRRLDSRSAPPSGAALPRSTATGVRGRVCANLPAWIRSDPPLDPVRSGHEAGLAVRCPAIGRGWHAGWRFLAGRRRAEIRSRRFDQKFKVLLPAAPPPIPICKCVTSLRPRARGDSAAGSSRSSTRRVESTRVPAARSRRRRSPPPLPSLPPPAAAAASAARCHRRRRRGAAPPRRVYRARHRRHRRSAVDAPTCFVAERHTPRAPLTLHAKSPANCRPPKTAARQNLTRLIYPHRAQWQPLTR